MVMAKRGVYYLGLCAYGRMSEHVRSAEHVKIFSPKSWRKDSWIGLLLEVAFWDPELFICSFLGIFFFLLLVSGLQLCLPKCTDNVLKLWRQLQLSGESRKGFCKRFPCCCDIAFQYVFRTEWTSIHQCFSHFD